MMERTKTRSMGNVLGRLVFLSALAAAMLHSPSGVFAQDEEETEEDSERNWELMVGAGGSWSPIYPGSDEMSLTWWPAIKASYDSHFIRWFIEFNELGAEVNFGTNVPISVTAGVGLGDFERDNDDADMLDGSPSIKNSVRFFGQLKVSLPQSVGLGARATYFPIASSYDEANRKDHDYAGLMFDFFLEREWMLFPFIASVSGGCTWMGSEYAEAAYGVEYATADLAEYEADAGLHDVYFTTNLMLFITDHIGIGTTIECAYLLGDAADSPFTEKAFQPTIGAYALYRF